MVNWAERLARKVEDTGLNPISKSACLVLVVDSLLVCGACYTSKSLSHTTIVVANDDC